MGYIPRNLNELRIARIKSGITPLKEAVPRAIVHGLTVNQNASRELQGRFGSRESNENYETNQ